jgi:hypothetical protein
MNFDLQPKITIKVPTALLPTNFIAPPNFLNELQCHPDIQIQEYSDRDHSYNLRNTLCIPDDGSQSPWMMANPTQNWSIIFHSDNPILGTNYWINYKPHKLLEYLRIQTDKYTLTYYRNDIRIFTFQVAHYIDIDKIYVKIDTIWHISFEADFLKYIPMIFSIHNLCIVCLDDAFLVKWPACTHYFCNECINKWRDSGYITCPLCRAT